MKIRLNKEVYNIDSIKECINVYKEVCNVTIISVNMYYEININGCKYDEEETANEFCNYLIAVLNGNR